MEIVEINTYSDFLLLKQEWATLLKKCKHKFSATQEWLSTWWKYFGKNKKLIVLIAKENGEIIGAAPLMYSVYEMFGLRRGVIEFIGTPSTDYNNFVISKKHEKCMMLFLNHLNSLKEKWDAIILSDISEDANCLPFLAKNATKIAVVHECRYRPLPRSYERFLSSFGHDKRRYFKKTLERIEKDFDVKFVDYSTQNMYEEGMKWLIKLHQKRWNTKGQTGVFADPRSKSFNLEIAKVFAEKKWLGLYGLKLNDEVVAADYGFKYDSKYHAYLCGFDPDFAKYNVGNALRLYMVRDFLEKGIIGYDFMRGAEAYKDFWGAVPRRNYQAVLTNSRTTARIRHFFYEQFWRQANRIRYMLKLNT